MTQSSRAFRSAVVLWVIGLFVTMFPLAGQAGTRQVQITASDGSARDRLGMSVAISGDTAIVGSLDDAGAGLHQGAAYVFTQAGETWTEQAKLVASDGAALDRFSYNAVAVSGGTALVGSMWDDVGVNPDQGSAYIFTRSGGTWTQQAKLTASDGLPLDNFGFSVALSGDTAVIGAYWDDVGVNPDQGSAYVFTREGGTWTEQAKLTAPRGVPLQEFGHSVALSDDTILVGAQGDLVGLNPRQGSAYVFTRSGSTWTQQAQLVASDGEATDGAGFAVALSRDTAVVGAYFDDTGDNEDQGSAYVFNRTGSTWAEQVQLTASDGAANDLYGRAVAIAGRTILVGAQWDDIDGKTNQGSAYLLTRSGGTWTEQAKLTAPDGAADDLYGTTVAMSGEDGIIGASFDDVGSNGDQGSAYVFGHDRRRGSYHRGIRSHNDRRVISSPRGSATNIKHFD
ncbi:MAG: FG-GAP repeat protein [Actinomycetota bacterium]|nr:FG-GAP repeat protein [Actinomycetota bacterium]